MIQLEGKSWVPAPQSAVGTRGGMQDLVSALQDVSRRGQKPLPNKFTNWSLPLGLLLVCHNLLWCCFSGNCLLLVRFSEQNISICLPYFSRGLKAGGIRRNSASYKTCIHRPSGQSTCKESEIKRKWEKDWLREAPGSAHMRGNPLPCCPHCGSGFNRKIQLYIPAMPTDLAQ